MTSFAKEVVGYEEEEAEESEEAEAEEAEEAEESEAEEAQEFPSEEISFFFSFYQEAHHIQLEDVRPSSTGEWVMKIPFLSLGVPLSTKNTWSNQS